MHHTFLVVIVKKLLKSVYIYGSYREIRTVLSLFLDHSIVWLFIKIFSVRCCGNCC